MGYSTGHLHGSGDEDPPLSSLADLYDELRGADGEHTDVSVTDDETGSDDSKGEDVALLCSAPVCRRALEDRDSRPHDRDWGGFKITASTRL